MAQRLQRFAGSGVEVRDVAVLPGGRHIAAADALAVAVWHAPSGERVWSRALSRTTVLAASPGGDRLVAGGPQAPIAILDAATGETLATGATTPSASRWLADGRLLHLSTSDGRTATVHVGTDHERVRAFEASDSVRHARAAISPDGRRVALERRTVHLFDVAGSLHWRHHVVGPIHSFAFSPDAELVAYAAGHELQIVNVSSGVMLSSHRLSYVPQLVAWSPAAPLLAVATQLEHPEQERPDRDGPHVTRLIPGVLLVTLRGGAPASLVPLEDLARRSEVTALAFSSDGALLAEGAADGSLRLWRVP
jgi:WD40 repeat protein